MTSNSRVKMVLMMKHHVTFVFKDTELSESYRITLIWILTSKTKSNYINKQVTTFTHHLQNRWKRGHKIMGRRGDKRGRRGVHLESAHPLQEGWGPLCHTVTVTPPPQHPKGHHFAASLRTGNAHAHACTHPRTHPHRHTVTVRLWKKRWIVPSASLSPKTCC